MTSYIRVNEDLELRLLEERDTETLFELTERNRPRLSEWLTWMDIVRSVEETRRFIGRSLQQSMMNQGFTYGMWHRGALVGFMDMHDINWGNGKVELGYWIGEEHEGQGVVTVACRALVDYLFSEAGMRLIEIHCAPGNARSRGIPERLGFREERVIRQAQWIRDHFVDYIVYVMDSERWQSLNLIDTLIRDSTMDEWQNDDFSYQPNKCER